MYFSLFVTSLFYLPLWRKVLVSASLIVSIVSTVIVLSHGPSKLGTPPSVEATSTSEFMGNPAFLWFQMEHVEIFKTCVMVIMAFSPLMATLPLLSIAYYHFPPKATLHDFWEFTPLFFWREGNFSAMVLSSVTFVAGFIDTILWTFRIPVSFMELTLFPTDHITIRSVRNAMMDRQQESDCEYSMMITATSQTDGELLSLFTKIVAEDVSGETEVVCLLSQSQPNLLCLL